MNEKRSPEKEPSPQKEDSTPAAGASSTPDVDAPSAPPSPTPPKRKDPLRTDRPAIQLARIDPQALLERALEKDAAVETIERLVALAKDVHAIQARQAYNDAMAEFQRQMPRIFKTVEADYITKGGKKVNYWYAPLDEILPKIQPVMANLGLSVTWTDGFEKGMVTANCRITHVLGHFEESGPTPIPIPTGELGTSIMQRVGISKSYARRYSLHSKLGIAPERDTDGQLPNGEEGRPEMPRRASEMPPEEGPQSMAWIGRIDQVQTDTDLMTRKVTYILVGPPPECEEFRTSAKAQVDFVREAGKLPVLIEWVETKVGRVVTGINPAPEGEKDPAPIGDR